MKNLSRSDRAHVLAAATLLATVTIPAQSQQIYFMVPNEKERTWQDVAPGDFGDQRDNIAICIYSGLGPWLVQQQDERSRLHELPKLEHVGLVQHAISREELAYVSQLKNVGSVWIGEAPEGVEVPSDALEVLADMPQLWQLQLCIHGLDETHLKSLRRCQRLTDLEIQRATEWQWGQESVPYAMIRKGEPSDVCAQEIASVKSLETLELSGCRWLTDKFVEGISGLPSLRSLVIDCPLLTDESLRIIAEQMHLERLEICSPLLTDDGVIRWLAKAKTLRHLKLTSPKLSDRAFDAVEPLALQSLNINDAGKKRFPGGLSGHASPSGTTRSPDAEPGVGADSR